MNSQKPSLSRGSSRKDQLSSRPTTDIRASSRRRITIFFDVKVTTWPCYVHLTWAKPVPRPVDARWGFDDWLLFGIILTSFVASLYLSNSRDMAGISAIRDERPQADDGFGPEDRRSHTSDRLKRPEGGSLMQFGPTSLWSYAQDSNQRPTNLTPHQHPSVDLKPGDWIDWARALPQDLPISKHSHDRAISLFETYYASWCMVVDMPAFLRDMELCSLVTRIPQESTSPTRTASYSPLLHNCVLYIGLHLGQDEWPDLVQAMDGVFDKHCAALIMGEVEDPSTSTLRALNLFATCLNVRKDNSARNSGYIYFGMVFASGQALGINLNCGHLVRSGQITYDEWELRNNTYWTVYQQDLLRAIASGRPPMLAGQPEIAFPTVNPSTDSTIWHKKKPQDQPGLADGLPSMASTVFHWSARLSCILRKVMDTHLYSGKSEPQGGDSRILAIAHELDNWHIDQPFQQPLSHPVPHLLVSHMMYHLTAIYLFRPYYRSQLDIVPSPAARCDNAAKAITELLRAYDYEHGLRNAVATLIPIVFATATIHLLALVSNHADITSNVEALDEAAWFMTQLKPSWIEASRGLEVINALRAEWLPEQTASIDVSQLPHSQAIPHFESEELPKELHEWLLGTNFYDILHGDREMSFGSSSLL
ncbi:hypothetical protein B9479_002543 [Cryptococcus floricola]|uniref:Xylanolytic transcriptional activator regulatory domain-containing protein n=1 Tax=Cryptococcus floricola TaxID=2591691 RepID=A0A5D3B3Q4_9TREE|nr:hypothetical protein B9479_002543 [Cryptococcus floricola]